MCNELDFVTHFFNKKYGGYTMSSKLWEKDTFINENIFYLFNKEIIEYDMKEAGFSLIKEYHLIDDNTLNELKKMGKEQRKIKIGKLQIKDDKLKSGLKESFKSARKRFFEENDIKDDEVISIKKDAIFVTKFCKTTKFGKHIDFRPKHEYSSYIRLDKKLEFYYSPIELSVKGIGDDKVQLHYDYLIKFINLYFKKMETSDNNDVILFLRHFIDKYKNRELDVGFYRNFNSRSNFSVFNDDNIYMEYWNDDKDSLDISYNYFNILLKLIKIPL